MNYLLRVVGLTHEKQSDEDGGNFVRKFDKALRLVVKEIGDPTAAEGGVQLSMEKTSELFKAIRSRVIDENIHCPKHVEKHKQQEESKQPPR